MIIIGKQLYLQVTFVVWISKMKLDDFYHLGFSDYCLHLYGYFHTWRRPDDITAERRGNNNKDEDNSPKTLNDKNVQVTIRNRNKLLTIIWFQVFLSNINDLFVIECLIDFTAF